jgi:hypothetical protein
MREQMRVVKDDGQTFRATKGSTKDEVVVRRDLDKNAARPHTRTDGS